MSFGKWGFWHPCYKIENHKNWEGSYMERECMRISDGVGYKFRPLVDFELDQRVILGENPEDAIVNYEVVSPLKLYRK